MDCQNKRFGPFYFLHYAYLIPIFVLLHSLLFVDVANGNDEESMEFYKIAKSVEKAVLREDIAVLMKYVSPSGTYFIDSVYTYAEVDELIRNKDSWLYKHLFVGENSVKGYFEKVKNLDIKIYLRNSNAIFVSYRASNYKPGNWVESCFIRIGDKWYFDGIFSCD